MNIDDYDLIIVIFFSNYNNSNDCNDGYVCLLLLYGYNDSNNGFISLDYVWIDYVNNNDDVFLFLFVFYYCLVLYELILCDCIFV